METMAAAMASAAGMPLPVTSPSATSARPFGRMVTE